MYSAGLNGDRPRFTPLLGLGSVPGFSPATPLRRADTRQVLRGGQVIRARLERGGRDREAAQLFEAARERGRDRAALEPFEERVLGPRVVADEDHVAAGVQ